MATKKVTENPTIADFVSFDILTPDVAGCFLTDPFKVDNVKIYYIERSFTSNNFGSIDIENVSKDLEAQLQAAKDAACIDPTPTNLQTLEDVQNEIEKSKTTDALLFKEAVPVGQFGDDTFPAWLSTDSTNAILEKIDVDEDGNPLFGNFELIWNPVGLREGDYFICWTWTPLPAGDKLSAHSHFTLFGNTQITTSIPTHVTKTGKYQTLQERYLPDMFKFPIASADLTPAVIQEFNLSVADGFTYLEDMGNQVVDLIDSNAIPESLIRPLASLFALKLRTNDPTLWRRQIKRAASLFKKKGTFGGLVEGLDQAGIKLLKHTKLWQIISPYTWQELFTVITDNQEDFTLSKTMLLPIDLSNFELFYRSVTDDTWTTLTVDYVTFINVLGVTTMTWVGDQLSVAPIILSAGDSVRVIYEINNVPGAAEQTLEDHIRTLSLADQRDERDQLLPLKNWNVRLIEEDDVLFDLIVTDRHPFVDPLVYGKVRTEFPYSENIYNMEEYNGSKRDSTDPCDIDKDFIDPCSACISGKYNVDLEIENISNDRIIEAQEVLKEFTPFHAVLHTMNLVGLINDFVQPPVEQITILAQVNIEESTIVDPPQTIFNRSMTELEQFTRSALASSTTVVSTASGTAVNNEIILFSQDTRPDQIGIDLDNPELTFLEVLAPSPNSGTYTVGSPSKNHAIILTGAPAEPLNQESFTFRLSNERLSKTTSATITQNDIYTFEDTTLDYQALGVKTQDDVDKDATYTGAAWKLSIPTFGSVYTILELMADGKLLIQDDATLPTSNSVGVTYTLRNDSNVDIITSTGNLIIRRTGIVDLTGGTLLIQGASVPSASVDDIRSFLEIGYFTLISGTQHEIIEFVETTTHQFIIDGYAGGDASGITVIVYQRLIDNAIGFFHYRGMTLNTIANQEVVLGILNGVNAPVDPNDILENDLFKENFLISINSDFFTLAEINGTSITLSGPQTDFTTTGTAVTYDILKFSKFTLTTIDPPTGMRFDPKADIAERTFPPMPGHKFEFLDRRGNETITITTENESEISMLSYLLNNNEEGQMDIVGQQESISVDIEWAE